MAAGHDSSTALNFAILEYLHELTEEEGAVGKEIGTVVQTLSTAFGLQLDNPKHVEQHSYRPNFLEDVFEAGVQKLEAKTVGEDIAELMANEYFVQYFEKIKEKGFFKGVEEGSKAYQDRFLKAAAKFKEKLKDKTGEAPASSAERQPTEADLARAEELKAEGNQAITAKDFERADNLYTQAIALAPNGPSSHIYYSNRAAARSHLGDHAQAAEDAERAIDLNPSYSKAYSRLGYAQFRLGNYEAAVAAYKRAIELDPSSATNREYLEQAEQKLKAGGQRDLSGGLGGMGGMGGLEGLLGGAGGGGMGGLEGLLGGAGGGAGAGGLAGLMNNPALRQMAQNFMSNPEMMAKAQAMMQNPGMMEAAQKMMRDPSALQNLMGGMGGGGMGGAGAGAGAGSEDMEEMMRQFQQSGGSPFGGPGNI